MNGRIVAVSVPPDGRPWEPDGGPNPIIPGPKVEGARPVRTSARAAGVGSAVSPAGENSAPSGHLDPSGCPCVVLCQLRTTSSRSCSTVPFLESSSLHTSGPASGKERVPRDEI